MTVCFIFHNNWNFNDVRKKALTSVIYITLTNILHIGSIKCCSVSFPVRMSILSTSHGHKVNRKCIKYRVCCNYSREASSSNIRKDAHALSLIIPWHGYAGRDDTKCYSVAVTSCLSLSFAISQIEIIICPGGFLECVKTHRAKK